MKKLLFVLVSGLILLAGCTSSKDQTIKIGWIGPLTGQSAVLGIDSITAAQIAVDEINNAGGVNGRLLQLFAEDDQYSTRQTLSAYEKLVNQNGVKAILIQTYGGVFALAERAKKDGIVLLDTLDCNSKLVAASEAVFCLATDSDSLADVLAGHANKNFKKVGLIVFNSDAFMPYIKDRFLETYTGESVVEMYPAETTDFRSILLKMKAVDALVLLGYDETGTAMKQARDLGMAVPFLTTGTVTSPSLQSAAQGNAEGTHFAFWTISKNDDAKRFDDTFLAMKNRPPILDLATYPTYEGVKFIAYALQNSDAPLGQALLNVQDFTGITSVKNMAPDRSVRIPESLFVLKEGKPVKVE